MGLVSVVLPCVANKHTYLSLYDIIVMYIDLITYLFMDQPFYDSRPNSDVNTITILWLYELYDYCEPTNN